MAWARAGLVVVTGVCASGKSTLIEGLTGLGLRARHVAQEHSEVPWLWSVDTPFFLVVLDCDYETARARRDVSWGRERLEAERRRLAGAIANADLYLKTDTMASQEVLDAVVAGIDRKLQALAGRKGSAAPRGRSGRE